MPTWAAGWTSSHGDVSPRQPCALSARPFPECQGRGRSQRNSACNTVYLRVLAEVLRTIPLRRDWVLGPSDPCCDLEGDDRTGNVEVIVLGVLGCEDVFGPLCFRCRTHNSCCSIQAHPPQE